MVNGDFLSIFLIAIGLSADCFAVALGGAISRRYRSWLGVFRAALSFGFFQALMPVLGWLAGRTVVELIADYDHWVAFALLAVVSVRMLWEAFRPKRHEEIDITKGLLLLTLSIATSIDALAVGLSFAFLNINIVLASLTIGIVAFVVTVLGFIIGRRAGELVGKRAEAIGGVILLVIAFRILLSHLL